MDVSEDLREQSTEKVSAVILCDLSDFAVEVGKHEHLTWINIALVFLGEILVIEEGALDPSGSSRTNTVRVEVLLEVFVQGSDDGGFDADVREFGVPQRKLERKHILGTTVGKR
jgi:hypothetical protein